MVDGLLSNRYPCSKNVLVEALYLSDIITAAEHITSQNKFCDIFKFIFTDFLKNILDCDLCMSPKCMDYFVHFLFTFSSYIKLHIHVHET